MLDGACGLLVGVYKAEVHAPGRTQHREGEGRAEKTEAHPTRRYASEGETWTYPVPGRRPLPTRPA